MIIKLKVKDLNIIEQAAKLIRDKFKIDLIVTQCSIEAQPAGEAVGIDGTVLCASREPELRIELTTTKDHDGWTEHIDLSYAIYGRDLKDGSLVDELIGGDLKKQAPDMRQVLRLAFILYDGIRWGRTGTLKKDYADKGWLPKVTNIQRQSYVK